MSDVDSRIAELDEHIAVYSAEIQKRQDVLARIRADREKLAVERFKLKRARDKANE